MTDQIFLIINSVPWPLALLCGFLLLFLNGVVSTPPSEVSLSALGLYASVQEWIYVPSIAITSIGNIIGCLVLYQLSKNHNERIMEFISSRRYLRRLTSNATSGFNKYGHLHVMFGRCIPNIRSVISIPAGISRMSIFRFGVYSSIGCTAWSVLWVSTGFYLGPRLLAVLTLYSTFAVWVLVITVFVFLLYSYLILKKME